MDARNPWIGRVARRRIVAFMVGSLNVLASCAAPIPVPGEGGGTGAQFAASGPSVAADVVTDAEPSDMPFPRMLTEEAAPARPAQPVGGLWYGIGAAPSEADVVAAARRYSVVILNCWEVSAMQRLKSLNPNVVVLMYKDLSSTRSYAGAADRNPAGIDYLTADRRHPEWFATDVDGNRIEWEPYPGHWQMAVWDRAYQQAWTANVVEEAVRDGWDGVFADNDFAHLGFYSSARLAGTTSQEQADQKIREGLDTLVATAGEALVARGKLLVPNLSESRLFPGRWAAHSRYGGAMEEHFAYWPNQLVGVAQGWEEQMANLSVGGGMALLVTHTSDPRIQRYAFASAAVRSLDRPFWMAATTEEYTRTDYSPLLRIPFGLPTGAPRRAASGVWSRSFERGWIAVNPTDDIAVVTAPSGLRPLAGKPAGTIRIPARDAVLLVR